MEHNLLLDYELAVGRDGYVVRALLRLSGKAPERKKRIPLNISIVLDRSGSMAGEKLDAARRAASALVQRLFPEDVVSVVAYDDEVRTVAAPGTGADQTGLSHAIRSIDSGGSTNLSGGWLRGRELVASCIQPGGVNRVLLMTDGQANVGILEPDRLAGLCREARERGVATTTIGFGEGYNEHLLRAMADAGGGHTYYIERPDQASAVFSDEIEGLLSLCAQNIDVEIRPSAAATFSRIHHSYPLTREGEAVRLALGDLYAREPKSLLMEFLVPGAGERRDLEVAQVRVAGDVLTAGGGVERQEVVLSLRTGLAPEGMSEPEIRREVLLQEAARAREEALVEERRGDFRRAERTLRETAQRLRQQLPFDADAMEEARDLSGMAARCATGAVSELDRKYMHQRAYDASRSKRGSMVHYSRTPASLVHTEKGDATRPVGPGSKLIAHAVAVTGTWGRGFSRALSARWPAVEQAYLGWVGQGMSADGAVLELGAVSFVPVEPDVTVALLAVRGNAIAGGAPLVDYQALERALQGLGEEALRTGASVHMPRIATGDGGASWKTVEQMVASVLGGLGVPVTVYRP